MPSFNPFTTVTGRNAFTLFEIRLDRDFIVFHGTEHESSGQLLKGTVVLCLPTPLKVEDVHLRLTGSLHLAWTDSKVTSTGVSTQKIDKTTTILAHRWQPFTGVGSQEDPNAPANTKGVTLPAGNYEWPFEFTLPGNSCESVEGIHEANVTYKLKATVARGKLAYDLHTYKRFRVIRTLESSALEFLHAMSVENIWPNKIEYSIVVPQKAVVFGSSIPLETRFTPLLKGLDLGDLTIKLIEVHDIILQSYTGHALRELKREREVANWTLPMSRDEHWQDMIEDTGQEGWVMNTSLDLPKKLGKCIQDVNIQGIKVRHKLKLVVALRNPDGHISELRATLPVTIFISPNMPLDDDGNLVRQLPQANAGVSTEVNYMAPPGYGEHVLDQLFEDVELSGLQTPGLQSGVNSPLSSLSRAGSSENLAAMMGDMGVTPAALSYRLQNVPLDASHRNSSWASVNAAGSGAMTPHNPTDAARFSAPHSPPQSNPLSRQNSDENSSGSHTPEHVDFPEMSVLSKVPSYQTAVRTPVRPIAVADGSLPDYRTAVSAPGTPSPGDALNDPMETINEVPQEHERRAGSTAGRRPTIGHRHHSSFSSSPQYISDSDERRRIQLMQLRERVA